MDRLRRLLIQSGLVGLLPANVHAACGITATDSLGPFYRRQAPFRSELNAPEETGELLRVAGRVIGGSACRPRSGAIVDVWHANDKGEYYDVGRNSNNLPEEFRLRGRVLTDDEGVYSFSTIMPGVYGSRPRHIHFVVQSGSSEPLITQLYFSGDPRLAQGRPVHRSLVRPVEKSADGTLTVRFDIVLDS